MALPPFNISIIKPDEYIPRKQVLPVTSNAIFETNSHHFHPEGLFSEAIFGQIGSRERLVRKGYLDLRTEIINPHLYRQLISLKGFYKDILASKTYAYYDKQLKDLVRTTPDDPKGGTGYAFFLENLPNLEFAQSSSTKRSDKIALLKKYNDRILITRYIVIPAGLRDVREEGGRVAPEEINKLYMSLMSLSQALPDSISNDPIFDAIRYKIQMQVQAIYDYIANLIDGKGGFASSKYTARSVVYANRNVITAPPLTRVTSPEAPSMFHEDEVMVPLFQGMKGSVPLMVNRLKNVFFDQVFTQDTNTVPLIDPDSLRLVYRNVDTSTVQRFTSSDGINDLINGFRNVEIQKEPVTIKATDDSGKTKDYYLYLVYDDGDEVYTLRNIEDLVAAKTTYTGLSVSELVHNQLQDIPADKFCIIGSAALQIYGYQEEPESVDILADKELYTTLASQEGWEQTDKGLTKDKLHVYSQDKLPEIKQTITVGDFKVVSPEDLFNLYAAEQDVSRQPKTDFIQHNWIVDRTKFRPITWVELFYIAAYAALKDRYCTATRHPVLLIENIQAYKLHLISTYPARTVKLRSFGAIESEVILPEYPRLDQVVKTSMSVSPSTLGRYDGKWLPSLNR